MFPSYTVLNGISGGRPREFRFHPRAVVMWGGVVSGCPPQHQPSSFFLLISSLLPQSSSLHELLSFPPSW